MMALMESSARRRLGRVVLRAGMVALALATTGTPAAAQTWRVAGTTAGFYAGETVNGLYFRCTGPSVTVNFSGFAARLPEGATYRIGVSVDGVARILKASAHTVRGRSVLVHGDSLAAMRPLIDDLRKGRSVEISTPAGRYVVPLAGSGQALGSILDRCAG